MSDYILLTAADCHLCGHGREVLDDLASEGLLTWREVTTESEEGLRLAASAPPLRPVLFDADGHLVAYGRLSPKRLRKSFAAAA